MCLSERSERHERIAGERLRGAPSRSGRSKSPFPRTPVTRAGNFGFFDWFRRAKFEWILRRFPAHWGLLVSKLKSACILTYTAWYLPTRLVRRWSGWRTVRARLRTNCHGFARGGGVISAQYPPHFAPVGASVPGARKTNHSSFARRNFYIICQEGVPRNGGLGVDDCERPLRVGAHRNQPPGHFWFLFGQTKRNPPRRAELFMYHPKNQ